MALQLDVGGGEFEREVLELNRVSLLDHVMKSAGNSGPKRVRRGKPNGHRGGIAESGQYVRNPPLKATFP